MILAIDIILIIVINWNLVDSVSVYAVFVLMLCTCNEILACIQSFLCLGVHAQARYTVVFA